MMFEFSVDDRTRKGCCTSKKKLRLVIEDDGFNLVDGQTGVCIINATAIDSDGRFMVNRGKDGECNVQRHGEFTYGDQTDTYIIS